MEAREHHEETKLQMLKKRRQGILKRHKKSGGSEFEIARLNPKHREASRTNQRVQNVRDVLEEAEDEGEDIDASLLSGSR
jgi:hypothetical protein